MSSMIDEDNECWECKGVSDEFCNPTLEYPRCWECEDVVRYRHAEARR